MEDYGGQGHYEEDNPFSFDGEGGIYDDQQLQRHQHQQQRQRQQQQTERRYSGREVDSFSGGDGEETDRRRPAEHRDSSSRKLFVGGISWETSEERFTSYFSKYGEIADSVIMTDKYSGRPRGFGFVTFADSSIADKVLEECHVIDGREVEVKRTIPREDMEGKSALRTKKIFVGGLPAFLSEDELKEYFSFYGSVVEHQIMLDHTTGRSRGFGFVTFAEEDAVERLVSEGKVHELGGKQVEIKKAEPKRAGNDYSGSQSKFRGSFNSSAGGYAKEYYPGDGLGGKVGRNFGGGYGGFDGYGGYGSYVGSYGGSSAAFYGGYGYGYGFGGPMYGGSAYGGSSSSYGVPSGYGMSGYYAGNRGYGRGGGGNGGSVGGGGGSIHGGGKGYGYNSAANGAAMAERYHPYGR